MRIVQAVEQSGEVPLDQRRVVDHDLAVIVHIREQKPRGLQGSESGAVALDGGGVGDIDQYTHVITNEMLNSYLQKNYNKTLSDMLLDPVTTNDGKTFTYQDGTIVQPNAEESYFEFECYFIATRNMHVHLTTEAADENGAQTGSSGGTVEVGSTTITTAGVSVNHGTYNVTITAPHGYNVSAVSIGNAAQTIATPANSVTFNSISISAITEIAVTYVNAGVCGFDLSASSATVQVGNTTTFTATPNSYHSNSGTITATSSDTSIATVIKSGNTYTVTAVSHGSGNSDGTATITISCTDTGCVSETFTVTVPCPAISISIDDTSLYLGETATITPTVTNGGSASITYTSSNPSIVSVNGSTIKALAAGTANITATIDGVTSSASTVTVSDPTLTAGDISVAFNAMGTLSATDTPSGRGTISYSVPDADNAKLVLSGTNNANYSAVYPGAYTVTATYAYSHNSVSKNITTTFTVTVGEPTFTIANKTINVNAVNGDAPAVSNGGNAPASIAWSSGTTSVATVNSSTGKLTGVSNGTTTITATATYASGYTKTATCTVTVTNPTLTIKTGKISGDIGETTTASINTASNPASSEISTYTWTTSDSSVVEISSASAASPTLTFKKNGSAVIGLKVKYTGNNTYEKTATNTVTITVGVPVLTMADQTVAKGDSVTFAATSANPSSGMSFSYSVDPAVSGVSINSSTGEVTVASNCSAASATIKATATMHNYTGTVTATLTIQEPTIIIEDIVNGGTAYLTNGTDLSKAISNNFGGTYTVTSSKTAVATAAVSSGNLVITPAAKGYTTITVTATKGSITATHTFTAKVALPESTDHVIYFTDNDGWGSAVIHAWGADGTTAIASRASMTKIGVNENSQDVYAYKFTSAQWANVQHIRFLKNSSSGWDSSEATQIFTDFTHNAFYKNGTYDVYLTIPQIVSEDIDDLPIDTSQTVTATTVNNCTPSSYAWTSSDTDLVTVTNATTVVNTNTVNGIYPGTSTVTIKAYCALPTTNSATFTSIVTDGSADAFLASSTTITVVTTAEDKTISWENKLSINDGASYDASNPSAAGTISVSPDTITNGASVAHGTLVTFTASANPGYAHVGWQVGSGSVELTTDPKTISVRANTTVYALFKKTYTVTLTTNTGFATKKYKIGASGSQTDYSSTITVNAGTYVVFDVTYSNGYEFDSVSGAEASNQNTTFTTSTINSNTTVTLSAKKSTYNLSHEISPNYGTLKFYSDQGCTTEISTAQINDVFYAKYTPPTDAYSLDQMTVKDGTGTGTSRTALSGNIGTFTMGYSNTTIRVTVKATTPVFNGTWSDFNAYAGEEFTYANSGSGTVTPDGCTLTYSFNGGNYQNTATFDAPSEKGNYTLKIKASNQPTGIATAATAEQQITVHVTYRQVNATYYVDMHNNTVSNNLTFAVLKGNTYEAMVNNSNETCSGTMTQQSGSTVYAITINTPYFKSGSSNYSTLRFRITYGSNNYDLSLNTTRVAALISSREVWIEAVNESSLTKSVTYETNSTPTVASGYRRIYLAKPLSWASNETKWQTIGIYHWGKYTNIGWTNGIRMSYLGCDEDYHYYYADIPKTVTENDKTYKVKNIIFQGWDSANPAANTNPSAQTENIEDIADTANYFVLSKESKAYIGTAGDPVTIPGWTKKTATISMNVGESSSISIVPSYTGANVTYSSSDTTKVTVDENGVIHPVASTINQGTNTPVTVTAKVLGTVGNQITDSVANGGDAIELKAAVTIHNPSVFNGFELMSLESQVYTINIPAISGDQPGYFSMSDIVVTVTGIQGVSSSTNSAIIYDQTTANVTINGSRTDVPVSFKVKYAKAPAQALNIEGYSNIQLSAKIVTKSIRRTGERYGHEKWQRDENDYTVTTTKSISGGVETATTAALALEPTYSIYSAVFHSYPYVDVTFNFNYYEYKPQKVTDTDTGLQVTNYFYDPDYVGVDDRTAAGFDPTKHNQISLAVSDYEVRGYTATGSNNTTAITSENLVNFAAGAIEVMPASNYYNYSIDSSAVIINSTDPANYKATVTVNIKHKVRYYHVYVNGTENTNSQTSELESPDTGGYYYQDYAECSVDTASKWYAVNEENNTTPSNTTDPLLASGTKYRFRVKGDTYLRTVEGVVTDFNRSENDFSHYEITHREKVTDPNTNPVTTEMREYVLQNFYIADFFDAKKVLDPNSTGGALPYDDVEFVGGGVVYYSMTNGSPFANAVSAGYVDGTTGQADADMIMQMLQSNILKNYSTDLAAQIGTEDAMRVAYGTEIPVTKNVENGFNTGIYYRYLPLESFVRENGALQQQDGNYTLATTLNIDTFRYSNTLQAYQYVYASGNENKATNSGKNMRLYSYYVYSYVAYNQETNVPETKYAVVLSDNYSDASTYWDGTN